MQKGSSDFSVLGQFEPRQKKRQCSLFAPKILCSVSKGSEADGAAMSFAPRGLRIIAQGCRAAATLGKWPSDLQPQRGCVTVLLVSLYATPLGLDLCVSLSQGSLPAAGNRRSMIRSPFGAKNSRNIESGCYPFSGNTRTVAHSRQPLKTNCVDSWG